MKLLLEQPLYKPRDPCCVFLGVYRKNDLYYCPLHHCLVVRYGEAKDAYLEFRVWMVEGCVAREAIRHRHPLYQAWRRAKDSGLL